MGEGVPLTSFEISHGTCGACEARLEAGEHLAPEYKAVLRFYRALRDAARTGDVSSCALLVQDGHAAGYGIAEMLVGLLQPALAEMGRFWEFGRVSVADEHRFTAWCERTLALLPHARGPQGPVDLLIFQAPGNRHDLGPRFACEVLRADGVRCEAVLPELPLADMLAEVRKHEPRWVGWSCALPEMVESCRVIASELRAAGFRGGVMVSGQAIRRSPDAWVNGELSFCTTVEGAKTLIRGVSRQGERNPKEAPS